MEDVQERPSELNPLTWLFRVVALPLQGLAWAVEKIVTRRYDPEKDVCPACGFKGDSGTGKKSCRITVVRTVGSEKAAIQHSCFRCSADYYTKLFRPAEMWMAPMDADKAAALKQAAAKETL